ncbi:Type II secretion system F domain [Moorella glycerini]|uniref:Flagellar assembly protein J n=1 Tax=Neomoorella stamsii TaxID=1266720 RepID=A0A9X7J4G2_9FIRM|nr:MULTISPECIES: type II secretion system F family protein [Moorella]PRR76274.1 flagellar assembly protein J [Moorella stamsii]CEP67158.1 Type II secretion system F domain [Moorella glycerini]
MVELLYAVLAGAGVFCLVTAFFSWRQRNPLAEWVERRAGATLPLKARISLSLQEAGRQVQGRIPRVLADLFSSRRLALMLRLAGTPFGLAAEEFQGLLFLAALAGIATMILGYTLGTGVLPGLLVLGVGAGLPLLGVQAAARRTQARMRRSLGYFIRQLAVGAAGRVSILEMFKDMAANADHDPLAREIAAVVEEVERGGRKLTEALHNMARNIDLPEAYELAAELAAAERYGGEGLAAGLKILARSLDARRETESIAAIQKAETQITMVITITVVISGSIFMVGALVLNFLQVWH